jgi:hypothetical protein
VDVWDGASRSHTPGVDAEQRWARLFTDLEGELDELAAAERAAEVTVRARTDAGRRTLADRLVAARGTWVRLHAGGNDLSGVIADAGPDWVLLDAPARLLAVAGLHWVEGIEATATAPPLPAGIAGRFDLRMALRRLARERVAVTIMLCDSMSHHGTIDRVGADHLDLALHPPDEPRRARSVRAVCCVPLAAVVCVRPTLTR